MNLQELKNEIARQVFDGRDMDWVRKHNACIKCQQHFFIIHYDAINRKDVPQEDYKPGLVYSEAGMRECNMSGLCEYCYDKLNKQRKQPCLSFGF